MILPGTYQNGFAPRDGEPLFPELWDGCVGAWNPGLGPSGLTLRDWSPYKNHGTLTNMDAGTDCVASQGRYALDFDGVNDFVDPSSAVIVPGGSGSITIAAHVQPRSLANIGIIAAMMQSANNQPSWMFGYLTNGRIYFATTNGNNGGAQEWVSTDVIVTVNTMHHLSVSYSWGSGASIRVYANGRSVGGAWGTGNGNVSYTPSTLPATIGRVQHTGVSSFFTINGFLFDVMIFNQHYPASIHSLLASRRGIAYEMAPRSWSADQIAAYRARYYSQVIGSGVI